MPGNVSESRIHAKAQMLNVCVQCGEQSRVARSSSCHTHSLKRSLSFCCASRARGLLLVDDAGVLAIWS